MYVESNKYRMKRIIDTYQSHAERNNFCCKLLMIYILEFLEFENNPSSIV